MSSSSRRHFLKSAACATAAVASGASAAPEQTLEASTPPAAPTVPRRPLGRTGESVPILNMGGALEFDPVYDKLLHRALAEGIDYFDTARVYAGGRSHRGIAKFLKQTAMRDKIWITSKEMPEKPSIEAYGKGLERCLRELELDHLDLFLMHSVDDPALLAPEFVAMGESMKRAAKTRFFGFSAHGERLVELLDTAARVGGFDVIMFRYSFAQYGDLELNRAIDACVAAGIGLIAMKVQQSIPDQQEKVTELSSEQFTLGQAKLKAVWADQRISSICSHMDSTAGLAENVAAARSPLQLSMHELHQLRRLDRQTLGLHCLGCAERCQSQVAGPLRIADILRYQMYAECYGQEERGRELYARLSAAERDTVSLDLAAAEAACPRHIEIGQRLAAAQRRLSLS